MKINFKVDQQSIRNLEQRLIAGNKAVSTVSRQVARQHFRPIHMQLRSSIPQDSGQLRSSFILGIANIPSGVAAILGFRKRRATRGQAVAANVLQAGVARPKKSKFLWIPIQRNADGSPMITPRQFFRSGRGFVRISRKGNMIAFLRDRAGKAFPFFALKKEVRVGSPLPILDKIRAAVPQVAADITKVLTAIMRGQRKE